MIRLVLWSSLFNLTSSAKKNGGTCFDDGGSTKFSCTCDQPFFGERCEINLCESIDCKNGGICVVNTGGSAKAECSCPDNTGGETCEHLSCDNDIPCYNDGTCNGETCLCSQENGIANYYGVSCDMPAACNGNPCQNGGTCAGKTQSDGTQVGFDISHFTLVAFWIAFQNCEII